MITKSHVDESDLHILEQIFNPKNNYLPNRRGVMKKRPTVSNSTAWGLYLERPNHKKRRNMIYTKWNVSQFCSPNFMQQLGKVPEENFSEMELHWRSDQILVTF